ncbi:hypothetical protein STEG23_004667 [Scotinomys teguina]
MKLLFQPLSISTQAAGLFTLFCVYGSLPTDIHLHTWCPYRSEEGIGSTGTGIMEGFNKQAQLYAFVTKVIEELLRSTQ